MAIRTKTIEYPFDTRLAILQTATTIGSATRYDASAINVDIPENSSRTFRSVLLVMTFRDQYTTVYNVTAYRMGIKIGAVAASDVDTTVTFTATADHMQYTVTRDATAYFTTNYSGTTQSVIASLAVATSATANVNNITAKLIITYDYDDSAQDTRIKTVRIPIESIAGQLTGSSAEVGTNQVPALDTFLPEASKTYKQIWFECYANDGGNAGTNFNLFLALDSEGAVTRATLGQTLNSGVFFQDYWIRNDMNTAATHAFKAYSSLTARFTNFGVVLCVTYTYSHTSSTRIINSLVMGGIHDHAPTFGNTAAGDRSQFSKSFQIAEPGTITLVQSGLLFLHHSLNYTLSIGCGSQAVRAYTVTTAGTCSGNASLVHRIDSGGAQGAGITLAAGANSLIINWRSGTANSGCSMSAVVYLNYTSDKHTSGDGAHAHSVFWIGYIGTANIQDQITGSIAPVIPEADYWINDVSLWLTYNAPVTTAAFEIAAEPGASEGFGDGWIPIMAMQTRGVAKVSTYHFFGTIPQVRRFVGDVRSHPLSGIAFDFETARRYRAWMITSGLVALHFWYTYSSTVYTVSGSILGYTGDGSGITVSLHNASTGELLKTTTTASGGGFSFSWYDNVTQLYVEAQQDSTHMGRSVTAAAA
jgi:hypothetical protein